MKQLPRATAEKTKPIKANFKARRPANGQGLAKGGPAERIPPTHNHRVQSHGPALRSPQDEGGSRAKSHETRFCKTNPICKNAKQPESYVQKGLMKHLPRATAEKTKPIQTKSNPIFELGPQSIADPAPTSTTVSISPTSSYPIHPPSIPNSPSS